MATATLTFRDEPDGAVNLTIEFEPALDLDGAPSHAQISAAHAARFIQAKVAGPGAVAEFLNDLLDDMEDDDDAE